MTWHPNCGQSTPCSTQKTSIGVALPSDAITISWPNRTVLLTTGDTFTGHQVQRLSRLILHYELVDIAVDLIISKKIIIRCGVLPNEADWHET